MNKLIITALIFLSSSAVFSQQQDTPERVMLASDSLPIFAKMQLPTEFSDSFFYCSTDFTSVISNIQFDNYNNTLTNHNPDIKSFFSSDKKSVITIFPKHTIKGIASLSEFLGSYFQNNNFPGIQVKSIKHIQIVGQNDLMDANHGFN